MAAGDFGTTNLFGLGDEWLPQAVVQGNEIVKGSAMSEYGVVTLKRGRTIDLVRYAQTYHLCNAGENVDLAISLGAQVGDVWVTGVDVVERVGQPAEVTMHGVYGPTLPDGLPLDGESATFDDIVTLKVDFKTDITTPSEGLVATEKSSKFSIGLNFARSEWGLRSIFSTSNPMRVYRENGLGTIDLDILPAIDIVEISCDSFENSQSNQAFDTYSATFSGPFVNPFS